MNMSRLFIQEKLKTNLLVLKVVTNKEKIHSLIEKKSWKSTLISEQNICYLYLNKESNEYNFHSLFSYFANFANHNERSWNLDIQSFISKNLTEEKIIQAISEGILFGAHQPVEYKEQKNKKQNGDYYLITKHKEAQAILDNSSIKLEAVN